MAIEAARREPTGDFLEGQADPVSQKILELSQLHFYTKGYIVENPGDQARAIVLVSDRIFNNRQPVLQLNRSGTEGNYAYTIMLYSLGGRDTPELVEYESLMSDPTLRHDAFWSSRIPLKCTTQASLRSGQADEEAEYTAWQNGYFESLFSHLIETQTPERTIFGYRIGDPFSPEQMERLKSVLEKRPSNESIEIALGLGLTFLAAYLTIRRYRDSGETGR